MFFLSNKNKLINYNDNKDVFSIVVYELLSLQRYLQYFYTTIVLFTLCSTKLTLISNKTNSPLLVSRNSPILTKIIKQSFLESRHLSIKVASHLVPLCSRRSAQSRRCTNNYVHTIIS